MRTLLLVLASLLAGCGPSTTCDVCGTSFTDAECQEIAVSHGCESGVSSPDTLCSEPTVGCEFKGCPVGEAVECDLAADTDN
jgi:hypothetical protein